MRRSWIAGCLGLSLLVAACGEQTVQPGEPYVPPETAGQAAAVKGGDDPADLPASQRAALVSAHAVSALALMRAGEAEAGKRHLTHLDAGAHPGLMVGLDTLGYDPLAAAEAASANGAGTPEVEAAFAAADAMLAALRPGATGDVAETTGLLMKTLEREYEAGAEAGVITDAEAYETAYGLAVVARDIVAAQDPMVYSGLKLELELLVRMWPGLGPLPGSIPAPESEMAMTLSNVKLALAALP